MFKWFYVFIYLIVYVERCLNGIKDILPNLILVLHCTSCYMFHLVNNVLHSELSASK